MSHLGTSRSHTPMKHILQFKLLISIFQENLTFLLVFKMADVFLQCWSELLVRFWFWQKLICGQWNFPPLYIQSFFLSIYRSLSKWSLTNPKPDKTHGKISNYCTIYKFVITHLSPSLAVLDSCSRTYIDFVALL